MSDIFVSYARSTETQARQVAEALRALGYGVWRDDELPAHRAYADVIDERLRTAKAVVVVWSADAARSEWVRSEAERARSDRKLVQLTVDGSKLPMPFDQTQCADLTGWTGDAQASGWLKVVGSIAELTGRAASRPSDEAQDPTPRSSRPPLSVCVLPFANMSGDPEQEYFSDGISEDIITDLSKISALSVVSRNSAFQFKGRHVDVRQVARQLGVSHVLEGSVRKAGARVRITAQLIEGAADSHVWAERYDRDLTDIFALQDEISQAIVAALKLRLLPEEKQAITQRDTTNLDAYNLYLLARQHLLTGNAGESRHDEVIIRLCSRAVDIDPGFARAWALMAAGQATMRYRFGSEGEGGLSAAERAIALDANLADAHAVKAYIHASEGDLDQALTGIELALRLDAESVLTNRLAGIVFTRLRRFEDAARYYAKTAALDDGDFATAGLLSSALQAAGHLTGAREAARMTLVRSEAAVARDPANGHAMAYGAGALAMLGDVDRAHEWMQRALLVDPDNLLMRYNFGCMLSVDLHDLEAALAMLGPVLAKAGLGVFTHAKADPDLDFIRDDPRFQRMMADAKIRLAKAG